MDDPAWPLFGLRLRTPRLELAPLREADVPAVNAAIDAGIHDPSFMPFATPFTDVPADERAANTYQWYWRTWAEWTPGKWSLPFGVRVGGDLVGIQSLEATNFVARSVASGSWLCRDRQGHGFGKDMRTAILELAFAGLGADEAVSESFVDNESSKAVSSALGYQENGRGRHAPRGEPRETVRWRLTRERWKALKAEGRYVPVEIDGLEPCLPLFGLA